EGFWLVFSLQEIEREFVHQKKERRERPMFSRLNNKKYFTGFCGLVAVLAMTACGGGGGGSGTDNSSSSSSSSSSSNSTSTSTSSSSTSTSSSSSSSSSSSGV